MSKKKLNNLNLWLAGEPFELGEHLNEIEPYIPPAIYYLNGVPEFDAFFSDINYIASGYICHLVSYTNSISVFIAKHNRSGTIDMGVAHIERKYVTTAFYEKVDDLLFPKGQRVKSEALRNWGRMGGLIGVIGSEVVGAIDFKVQTKRRTGVRYILKYMNKMGEEKELTLYTSIDYFDYITSFLTLYYNPILEEFAEKPVEKSDGNCFIATACYKSKYSDEVLLFKKFRDKYLLNNFFGRGFVKFYYFLSPKFLLFFGESQMILRIIKSFLDKIYSLLRKFM